MTRIVILAAGKGTRMMNEELPKVLHSMNGKPMIEYVLDAVQVSRVDMNPIIIVGFLAEKIKEVCGKRCAYAQQVSLRGTGDAVRAAEHEAGDAKNIIVLNGDMPFVSATSIQNTIDIHNKTHAVMTIGTVLVNDFEEWRKSFKNFGRIIRNNMGDVIKITEARDATASELMIKEVNPSVFCFDARWLWHALKSLTTENAQGEYYITDLLEVAVAEGQTIATVPINIVEAIGINTPDQLVFAEKMIKN